jgi:hypothetical protein
MTYTEAKEYLLEQLELLYEGDEEGYQMALSSLKEMKAAEVLKIAKEWEED